eukprot:1338180-Amphidinium_carterae.1
MISHTSNSPPQCKFALICLLGLSIQSLCLFLAMTATPIIVNWTVTQRSSIFSPRRYCITNSSNSGTSLFYCLPFIR